MNVVKGMVGLGMIVLLLAVAGCGGGGGGGGGDNPETNGAVSVDVTAFQFSASRGGSLPASQNAMLTVNQDPPYIAGVAWASAGDQVSWLDVQAVTSTNPFTFSFRPNTTNLSPGTYQTHLRIGIADTGGSAIAYRTATITYTVTEPVAVYVGPSAATLITTPGVGTSTSLALTSDTPGVAWSLSGGTPYWLNVNTNAGTTPGNLTLTVGALAAGVYRTDLTLNLDGATKVVPVTVVVKSPRVTYVAPYTATTGTSGNVIIRGYGFSGITGHQVLFGSTPADSFTVVSDTEIHATYPALAAGSYSVAVNGTATTLSTRAVLLVSDAPSYSYAAVARPASASNGIMQGNVIYDAERKAIYVGDTDFNVVSGTYTDRVERYRFNGSSWVADAPIDVTGNHNLNSHIALSPDGAELLKTGYAAMTHVDPASWAVTATTWTETSFGTRENLNLSAMANDGSLVGDVAEQNGNVYYRYDVLDRAFYKVGVPAGFTGAGNRDLRASGDGSRIVAADIEPTAGTKTLYYYDAGAYAFVATSVATAGSQLIAADRSASRFVVQSGSTITVYNSAFTALGALAAPDAVAISPAGNALYTFVGSGNLLRKYDLTSSDGAGGFALAGSVNLADSPGSGVAMTLSPDGGTLVLAGKDRVIIEPAP